MSDTSVEIHVNLVSEDTPEKHVGTKVLHFTLFMCVCVSGTGHRHCSWICWMGAELPTVTGPGLPRTSQQIGFTSAVKLSTRRKQNEHLRRLAGPF